MFEFFLFLYFVTFFLCLSSYALYPVFVWALGLLFPFRVHQADIKPTISIIIPAYNEARDIERKIHNTLALDYPKENMEILIGSDGSTDRTAEIAKKFSNNNVRLVEFGENRGKTAVQNDLVNLSKGDVLIFTDAASFLNQDALVKIVRNFTDERVGCVAGRMHFVDTHSNLTTQSQGLYWRYEFKIRELESNLGHLIGVDGPLYAVRRDCYIALAGNMISDLITPLLVLNQKKRVVLESEALVYEDPTHASRQELATRRRITLRGLVSLFAHPELLNPLKFPLLSAQIFLHKILRWFVGPLVFVNGLACIFLSSNRIFATILGFYCFFALAAAGGWILDHFGVRNRLLVVPYYFTLVNLAATLGIIDFLRKKQAISWKPYRH
jgi:cellulose synthase/poly-beta-1,6-N-acetylglucosamine synthase-like glycosyltransferase